MPTDSSESHIRSVVQAAAEGNREALGQAYDQLYDELHEIAGRQMRKEGAGRLLQTTAIVHEAYLKLATQSRSQWKDRHSFFAAATVVMKRLLIDHARQEKSLKRGGKAVRSKLSDSQILFDDQGYSVLEINDALEKLSEFAPEQATALEMMIFGGMTGEEVAKQLQVSASTIDRKVRSAKAWLRRELS